MLGNHLGDGLLDAQAFVLRLVDGQPGQILGAEHAGCVRVDFLVGGAFDHQHHFAARWIVHHTVVDFGDGAAADLLVILGEFAAQRHAAVRAEGFQQVVHGVGDAVQRLIEHDGARFRLEHAQMLHALGVLAWQESFVAEAVGGQAGQAQCVEYGAGAGGAGDGQVAFDGAAHDGQTGIVDGGHAGVGNHQHGRTDFHVVEQAVGLIAFVVVVVGDHAAIHVHAETVRQVV